DGTHRPKARDAAADLGDAPAASDAKGWWDRGQVQPVVTYRHVENEVAPLLTAQFDQVGGESRWSNELAARAIQDVGSDHVVALTVRKQFVVIVVVESPIQRRARLMQVQTQHTARRVT